ncbi:hypothetical protein [Candidatus Palauibacter sp.]|uniref:hypothetical protein n=1 Tax=Candidatus Palauibacter sp. TaxID=3101350 RepID=UPI003B517DF7
MNPRHVKALVHLEVRRLRSTVSRLYLVSGGLLAALALLGSFSGEMILPGIVGGTAATTLQVPRTVLRDKVERTMEFLLSLPASVPELVLARFVAGALVPLPGCIAGGIAFALLPLPAELQFMGRVAPFGLALGLWLLLTLMGWCMIAVGWAFDRKAMTGPFVVLVAGVLFILPWVIRTLGPDDPGQSFRWFLGQPFAGAAVAAAATVVVAATATAAFLLACRGVARYAPRPEEPL